MVELGTVHCIKNCGILWLSNTVYIYIYRYNIYKYKYVCLRIGVAFKYLMNPNSVQTYIFMFTNCSVQNEIHKYVLFFPDIFRKGFPNSHVYIHCLASSHGHGLTSARSGSCLDPAGPKRRSPRKHQGLDGLEHRSYFCVKKTRVKGFVWFCPIPGSSLISRGFSYACGPQCARLSDMIQTI